MGQLENLRTFVHVVDDGSVSETARRLTIAKSAISRRLALLEARYDTRLIDRGPGIWAVTAAGRELYDRAVRLLSDVDDIDADFVSIGATVSGPLAVSVPRDFGLGFLREPLVDFARSYPAIALSLNFDDRVVDLERENIDFAIRITGSSTQRFAASRIGSISHALYASPDYLAAAGMPESVDALRAHRLLCYGSARRASWRFGADDAASQVLSFRPYLNSNSGQFLLQAAVAGLGIVRLPDSLVVEALRRRELTAVLPGLAPPDWGIYLLYADNRRLNRRMKLFLEEMKAACLPAGA